jgi:ABC-type multidrug transport system ATPase subunit
MKRKYVKRKYTKSLRFIKENNQRIEPRIFLKEMTNKDNSLTFKDLTKTVKYGGYDKQILSKVSGIVNGGEVCALMGCSGSGKTTLLQILGGRAMENTKGKVFLGSHQYRTKTMKKKVAYVLQDDVFMPSNTLTVRDHLQVCTRLTIIDYFVHSVIYT